MVVVQKKKKKWGKLGNTDHLVETRRWEIDYVQFNTSNNSRCSWHRETINYQKKHFSNVETPKFPSPPPPQRELHPRRPRLRCKYFQVFERRDK